MAAALSSLQQGAQGLGTYAIWKNIIGSVVFALVLAFITAGVFYYHKSWKLKTCLVTDVDCAPPHTVRSCDNNGNCTTQEEHRCTVHMDACHTISSVFGGSHPEKGDSVKVYFNPSDESQSMLASDDFSDAHKPWILLALISLIVIILASAALQFAFLNNKSVQTFAGAVEGVGAMAALVRRH